MSVFSRRCVFVGSWIVLGPGRLWAGPQVASVPPADAKAPLVQESSSTAHDLVTFQLNQARQYLVEGKATAAQTIFEEVFRSSPTAPGILEGLAEAQLTQGDSVGGERTAGMILDRDKKNPEGWVLLARAAYVRGEYKRVLKLCNRALRYDPHCSTAYFWRGRAYEVRGQQDEAKNEYHAATLCNKR